MPRFHDPDLRTPERVRAVAALHWLGVLQMLFIVAVPLYTLVDCMIFMRQDPNARIDFARLASQTSIIVLQPAVGGVFAIAAAMDVCRRERGGGKLGLWACYISLFFLFQAWWHLVWLVPRLSDFPRVSPLTPLYLSGLGLYLCVGTVFAVSTWVRLVRFRGDDPWFF